ncbi:MAG: AAA family ATPase [Planctomycetota bacterium]
MTQTPPRPAIDRERRANTPDEALSRLREQIGSVFLGDPEAIDAILRCLLARGHMLIEDVPGVGKTLLAHTVAASIDAEFGRIQLTPDLLPSDVVGVTVIDQESGEWHLRKGPIFANIVLADEINRTTPRTQSAMLEAMNDASVSIDGHVHELEQPFMVIATQNPYEFEGTYPLPENQLDRFLMRISVGYASPEAEAELLQVRPATTRLPEITPVISRDEVRTLQQAADEVSLDDALRTYIVELARATRDHPDVSVGISTRGAMALAQAARATALLDGRDYCTPDDILGNLTSVCAHRLFLHGGGDPSHSGTTRILDEVSRSVAVPE